VTRDVLVGYLCREKDVSRSFNHSLGALIFRDSVTNQRLVGMADVVTGPLQLVESRNDLCKRTLAGGFDWLFVVDDDMGFQPSIVDDLLEVADPVERPVIGGLCFSQRHIKSDGCGGFDTYIAPTILQRGVNEAGDACFVTVDHYPAASVLKVGATGAACLLIHRSVLETIAEKWGPVWFDRLPDGGGVVLQGEDISFCDRLWQLEIPLFVHTGVRVTHAKTQWVGEMDFWTQKIAPPADEAVDVIVPVLHRPQNLPLLLGSLRASTGLARAWVVCEAEDAEEQTEARRLGAKVLRFHDKHTFAEKVNAAFRAIVRPAPWILLVGDDVRFRPGWLDHAQDVGRRYKAQVVATNDLLNERVMAGLHATHPMIRRSYANEVGAGWDGPGIVAHEGYRHWFVDDEISAAARMRGVFQAALGSHVEHRHPYGGQVPMDDIYRLGESHREEDQALFERRLAAEMEKIKEVA
jgi:GT2 family glycosyltransferase